MTVSGSKSNCGVKVIRSSRSMVDRIHINNKSTKQKQRGAEREERRQ